MATAQMNEMDASLPWNNGGKLPSEYTWDEFLALSGDHQELFFGWFETADAFEKWMNEAMG